MTQPVANAGRKGSDPTAGLQVYVVGGAVRDALLGRPAGDRDWVVVGATPEAMAERGFQPVGGDFPVFLHPHTHEEYALARTERKSGRGYKGFTFHTGPGVSLEDDLRRRDLTINAIARRPDGSLVDPLGGQADLHARVLRHVGQAFSEDPVRLLRLARFAARFPDFSIAADTLDLARQLVRDGEVDALVPERVWAEMAKALEASEPARFFQVLHDAGALERVLPGFVYPPDALQAELACAVQRGLPQASRLALALRHSPEPAAMARHVRAPSAAIDQSRLLPLVLPLVAGSPDAATCLQAMERADAFRRPERFLELVVAAACAGAVNVPAWQACLEAVRGIDAGAIARAAQGKADAIRERLHEERLAVLAALDT